MLPSTISYHPDALFLESVSLRYAVNAGETLRKPQVKKAH